MTIRVAMTQSEFDAFKKEYDKMLHTRMNGEQDMSNDKQAPIVIEPVTLRPLEEGQQRLWIIRSDSISQEEFVALQSDIRNAYPDERALVALLHTNEDLTVFGISAELAARFTELASKA